MTSRSFCRSVAIGALLLTACASLVDIKSANANDSINAVDQDDGVTAARRYLARDLPVSVEIASDHGVGPL